ncbi:hypothetical protein AB0O68_34815 [Streptomyces sp. NPDC087512]|uniref:hypothetical protein n=1 Tax=Streptomyces sp. NPDC087512 TaxID=3155059 RepID=UPI0034390B5F
MPSPTRTAPSVGPIVRVRCVTSPESTVSRSFHTRLGFSASGLLEDYDGPGLARVAFSIGLTDEPTRPARRLRVLDRAFSLEHHPELREPNDDHWLALVRAPEGLTVIRTAGSSVPVQDRWVALYDADPDHGLDEPGLLAAVLTPLARSLPRPTTPTSCWFPSHAGTWHWTPCVRLVSTSADPCTRSAV